MNENNDAVVLRAGVQQPRSGGAASAIMYVPGGVHEIACGCAGRAVAEVVIRVDEMTAAVLNASLEKLNRENSPQRALIDRDHEGKEALAWPTRFEWRERPEPGVYVQCEYSSLGEAYVNGKVYRGFSGSFVTDASLPRRNEIKSGKTYTVAAGKRGSETNPARIVGLDFPYAGTLTNNPAFHKNLPLWASQKKAESGKQKAEMGFKPGSGQGDNNNNNKKQKDNSMNTEEKAALLASIKQTEQELVVLRAKEQTAEVAQEILTKESEVAAGQGKIEAAELRARNETLERAVVEQRTKDAKAAVLTAVKRGAILAKDTKTQEAWEAKLVEDPSNLVLLAAIPSAPALAASAQRAITIQQAKIVREDSQAVLQAFAAERDPLERAALYKREIRARLDEGDALPLRANTVSLGTLAGTLVTQHVLELLKFTFPILSSISTNLSGEASKLNQTIEVRTVTVPATTDYVPGTGWADSDAVTVDVPTTMNKQKGVQIGLESDVISSTVRNLFAEFGEAQAYALTKAMVDDLYALFLVANFANYTPSALVDFGRSALIDVGVALDLRGVHEGIARFALLNAYYFGAVKKDSAIVQLGAFSKNEIIVNGVLPDVEGFRTIKAANLPTTANLVGFAGAKSSLCIAARPDADYTNALPGASYGNSMVVTDPDSGLSVHQVQFVDHFKAKAFQRISFIYGVAKGQTNAGQLIKSS